MTTELRATVQALTTALDDLINWMPRVEPAKGQQPQVDASIESACAVLDRGHALLAQLQQADPGPMRPTYYVAHPDGSYSIARPQPSDEEIAAQRDFTYALCDGKHGGSCCSDPDCYRLAAAPATPAAQPELITDHAWLLSEDMDALKRFCETTEDDHSYDVPKDRMRRLAELGVVHWCGGSRYSMTAFGQHVLDLLPEGWPRLPLKTQADHDADSRAAANGGMT